MDASPFPLSGDGEGGRVAAQDFISIVDYCQMSKDNVALQFSVRSALLPGS